MGPQSRAWRFGGGDPEGAADAALSLRLVAAPRRREGAAGGGGEGLGSMLKRSTGVWNARAPLWSVDCTGVMCFEFDGEFWGNRFGSSFTSKISEIKIQLLMCVSLYI